MDTNKEHADKLDTSTSPNLDISKPHKCGNTMLPGSGVGATLMFLYAICMIEGADMQLLPASFRALEVSLGLTPSSLAFLALVQALAQWTCTPVWGALADHGWSRKQLLLCGVFAWGVLTMLLAFCSNFYSMIFLRTLNGMALGCLSPISQSLIVDMVNPSERGRYFGFVQFASNVGCVMCAVGTSTISNQLILNFRGWRIAFAIVAAASLVLGSVMFLAMSEPARRESGEIPSVYSELLKLRRYLQIPTFRVIVLQGLFGCIPWSALSFMIFYFQYIGISDFGASILFGTSMVGGALGGILGGVVGDRLAKWNWKHGRPLTAQISVFCGIPLIVAILHYMPRDPSYYRVYQVLILAFGTLASWCATGVNRPILSEIVEDRDRASVFAWVITIDGSFAALLGAPMVGLLAENVFGYQPTTDHISEMPHAQREINADALSRAMLWCCIGPWVLCFICFSFLHFTYAQDVSKDDNEKPSEAAALLPN
jgi:MFS family permease